MKPAIRWAIRNTPAMNTLMIGALALGLFSLLSMRREVFPEFELEIVLVQVPYPGASPSEVEEGICQKIEEAVTSIAGIKKKTAVAAEGMGSVILELESDVKDVQKILNQVRSEVDRIPSFPALAEDPEVEQITMRQPAIQLMVIGTDSDDPEAEWKLRDITERIRDDLTRLPSVSQANILAAKKYQIDVEISEDTLRRYGLTLQHVANILRRENLELPGGTIKSASQDVLVKGKNKSQTGVGIARIPVVTTPSGVVLTVGDLGTVRDKFDDTTAFTRINGQPGMVISVDRTAKEDLLEITRDVKKFVAERDMPAGFTLDTMNDVSLDVRDRMELLGTSGLQGLALVFLVLAVFLELKLAFWVALGIPISMLGACIILIATGQTLNMLSMFAFLMALGIVVDDAIVIGENIYEHRQQGKNFFRAAVDGTVEVFPSVTASVCTTVIAFAPLMFVSGVMGKFIGVIPIAVISMLLISLFESVFILPCHLGHEPQEPTPAGRVLRLLATPIVLLFTPFIMILKFINRGAQRALNFTIDRIYTPILRWALDNPFSMVASGVGMFILIAGLVRSGAAPFVVFPKLDSKIIKATVTYPDGTPSDITVAATTRIESAIEELNAAYERETGSPVVRLARRTVGEIQGQGANGQIQRSSGGHVGSVNVELVDPTERDVTSTEIVTRWREMSGTFPGVESITFGAENMGPAGTPIEFKLLARGDAIADLEAAVEECKAELKTHPGVFDVADDSRPGKWEFQLKVKERARSMGVPLADVSETVRASYYGDEVMRLQRGRHEVKLMVRYPQEDRRSLADFNQIRVRVTDGAERPLTELAKVDVERGYSEINRVNQLRSITISGDVDEAVGNARNIVADLRMNFMDDLLKKYPDVSVRWEGQQEQTQDSMRSLAIGFAVAIMAMFVLLTLEFQSYAQPLVIMAVIPFGMIGAVIGHTVMGLPLSLFSMFGLVALTGVVVNDSIVLVDFINERIRGGLEVKEALLEAGRRRFRPVLLTSLTTIAGLLPILLETSFQAQILIPMANSLAFGLMLATLLVLVLVPTFYLLYSKMVGIAAGQPMHEA